MSHEWSADQGHAIDAILDWRGRTDRADYMTLGGFAGCLSGDAMLAYSRGRAGVRPITLRDLYLKFNGERVPGIRGISNRWVDLTVATRLYSLWPDGSVAFNRVTAVVQSGVKAVLRIAFDKGQILTCTPDHPIAVPDGRFVKAGGLAVGGSVMARVNSAEIDRPIEAKITGIESAGEEMTYDIQMESPANNFAANGIFVHNTGKTSLVAWLLTQWHCVATVALCGKAAHVLRSKGVDEAQTIHSLIYVPFENEEGEVRFKKREFLSEISTIICDEASMVDHILMRDLLSFEKPVLFVGDHGQLEPIGTNPRLMVDPTLRLETIHRQAMDNPIIRLAAAFREGRPVPKWDDPKGRVSIRGRADFERLVSPEVQILCGFNATRHKVNARVRKMTGKDKWLVSEGEKLICLKNNKEFGIFNGQQMTCRDIVREGRRILELAIETDTGRTFTLPAWKDQFGNNLIEDFNLPGVALLDYGSCVTCHKSQGSEYGDVLVLEELANVWDARRWRYTAATRAKDRLVYCA